MLKKQGIRGITTYSRTEEIGIPAPETTVDQRDETAKKATIQKGQIFVANSDGKPAIWVVTGRIKTTEINKIWVRCEIGFQQDRVYTGQQFGLLIRKGIIRLVKNKSQYEQELTRVRKIQH